MAVSKQSSMSFGKAIAEAYGLDPSLVSSDYKIKSENNEVVVINVDLIVTGEKLIEIGKLLGNDDFCVLG